MVERSPSVPIAGGRAALFDAISDGLTGEKRYAQTTAWFYERTKDHFSTLWRRYLTEAEQTLLVIIGLVELGGVAQKRRFSFGEIECPQRFGPELLRLEKLGLVEKIGKGLPHSVVGGAGSLARQFVAELLSN